MGWDQEMSFHILSINAGSSSLKTSLYKATPESSTLKRLASADVSNINQPPSKFKYCRAAVGGKQDGKDESKKLDGVTDHKAAFEHVLNAYLSDEGITEVQKRSDIQYACHRVVHGGSFTKDEMITEETFHKIEALQDLAPLHNASAVSLIRACKARLPDTTNIASFDSAFHSSIPTPVKTYMIDPSTAQSKSLRKYGFHGLSYSYITRAVAAYLHKPQDQVSIIALHLGSGASACAIKNGRSVDTTMGLTPVSGLPGSTRSGDIDPALVFHLVSHASDMSSSSTKELHISQAEEILNKKSGWKALTGTSDFAQIAAKSSPENQADAANQEENMYALAMDIFIDRILGYVGSYFVKLNGKVDALVFAGGVGEKSALLRQRVTRAVECLGFGIDDTKNEDLQFEGDDTVTDISSSTVNASSTENCPSRKVLVCATDEDYEMAYTTMSSQFNTRT